MKVQASLAAAVAAFVVAGAALPQSASAAIVTVNQVLDLTSPDFNISASSINFAPSHGTLFAPAVDIGVGDTLIDNVSFAENTQVTVSNLSQIWAAIWTQNWTNSTSVTSRGAITFYDSAGSVVRTIAEQDQGGCCVHLGVSFGSGLPAGTFTFASLTYTGQALDGPVRTYNEGHFTLRGSSVSLSTFVPTNAVPEPATWAMMIGGFMGAGAMLRRRNLAARATA
jgi:hypothetical protein